MRVQAARIISTRAYKRERLNTHVSISLTDLRPACGTQGDAFAVVTEKDNDRPMCLHCVRRHSWR